MRERADGQPHSRPGPKVYISGSRKRRAGAAGYYAAEMVAVRPAGWWRFRVHNGGGLLRSGFGYAGGRGAGGSGARLLDVRLGAKCRHSRSTGRIVGRLVTRKKCWRRPDALYGPAHRLETTRAQGF